MHWWNCVKYSIIMPWRMKSFCGVSHGNLTMVGANDLNIYTLAFTQSALLDSVSTDGLCPLSIVVHSAYTALPSSYKVSIYGVEEWIISKKSVVFWNEVLYNLYLKKKSALISNLWCQNRLSFSLLQSMIIAVNFSWC